MSEDNRKVIAEKCSHQEDPEMPNLPTSLPLLATLGEKGDTFAAITPPPGHDQSIAENQSGVVIGMARAKKGSKKGVTPSPMPPNGTSSKTASKAPSEVVRAPSKEALAIHRKWQAEAEKQGGPDVRIVVSKPVAKKLIFDMLHDIFRPMNITEIYQVS